LPVKKWNEAFVDWVIQARKNGEEFQKAITELERDIGQEAEKEAALACDELRHRRKPRSGSGIWKWKKE